MANPTYRANPDAKAALQFLANDVNFVTGTPVNEHNRAAKSATINAALEAIPAIQRSIKVRGQLTNQRIAQAGINPTTQPGHLDVISKNELSSLVKDATALEKRAKGARKAIRPSCCERITSIFTSTPMKMVAGALAVLSYQSYVAPSVPTYNHAVNSGCGYALNSTGIPGNFTYGNTTAEGIFFPKN